MLTRTDNDVEFLVHTCEYHFRPFSILIYKSTTFLFYRPIHSERESLLGRKVISQNQVDITKNLFFIVLAFLVLLIPQLVAEILDARPVVILHTSVLVTVICCINPVLYGLKHPFFRQVFKSIVMCRWTEIPQPAFKFLRPRPLPLNSGYPTEYLNEHEPILRGYRRLST